MKATAHPIRIGLLALCVALAGSASAQDDTGRAGREREALRRTQAALRQSQTEAAALAKDKVELAAQRDQSGEAAKRAQAQLSATRGETARLQTSIDRLETGLAEVKAGRATDAKAAQARVDELGLRLSEALRRADERASVVAATVALLEKSTAALAAAEMANARMHALGLQLIEQVRTGTAGRTGVNDPVLGFGQVQLENRAEGLRDQLEAARVADRAR